MFANNFTVATVVFPIPLHLTPTHLARTRCLKTTKCLYLRVIIIVIIIGIAIIIIIAFPPTRLNLSKNQ